MSLHERQTGSSKSIIGKLSPKKISQALDISAKAEKHVFGRAARELYKLSFQKSAGQLNGKAASRYERLLSGMKNLDEKAVSRTLGER